MSDIWYSVPSWGDEIKPAEVVKETPQFVVVRRVGWSGKPYDRRESKAGFFKSKVEAEAFVTDRLTKDCASRAIQLQSAENALAKWLARDSS